MMGQTTNHDSPHIMKLIKPNTVGAELGIWYGNTSKQFSDRDIKELHLVDSWSVEPYKESSEIEWSKYLSKYQKVTGEFSAEGFQRYYDKVYQSVVDKFKDDNRVIVHRMTTDDWFVAAASQGLELDWIYVDASHSYQGVLKDLESSLTIVKAGGLILGDDYRWEKTGKEGVTRAVDEFIQTHNLRLWRHGRVQYEIRI
jgi:hypothetical protein